MSRFNERVRVVVDHRLAVLMSKVDDMKSQGWECVGDVETVNLAGVFYSQKMKLKDDSNEK